MSLAVHPSDNQVPEGSERLADAAFAPEGCPGGHPVACGGLDEPPRGSNLRGVNQFVAVDRLSRALSQQSRTDDEADS